MGIFGNLFGNGSKDINAYLEKGAVVIDVRSLSEFQGGHVDGSKNIPLPNIESYLAQLKKLNKPLVLCCASGMRSGQATKFLKSQGLDCINGGSWLSINGLMAKH